MLVQRVGVDSFNVDGNETWIGICRACSLTLHAALFDAAMLAAASLVGHADDGDFAPCEFPGVAKTDDCLAREPYPEFNWRVTKPSYSLL